MVGITTKVELEINGDPKDGSANATVSAAKASNGDVYLAIAITTDGEEHTLIYIEGEHRIDALRRQCEMAIDHYRRNLLPPTH